MTFEVRGVTPLLQVYDVPTSVKFYRDMLGFEVVNTSPVLGADRFHWALLRRGDAEMMLNTRFESDEERPPAPEPARVAAHDDTALYFGCPDVDAAFEQLRGKGVNINKPEVTGYGMKQMYVHDPDGYNLCFQWPAQS